MPKEKIRTLLHHREQSKIDRRCRTCFIEIKMHHFKKNAWLYEFYGSNIIGKIVDDLGIIGLPGGGR